MQCQNCGADIPTDPRTAVEEDDLSEVVAHIQDGKESFALSETAYYCDLKCAAAAHNTGGGD